MSQPVLVRGSLANWPFVLLTVLAFLLLALAAWAGFAKLEVLPVVLGVAGVGLLALVPLLRWRQRRQRMWVEDRGNGFKVTDFIGDRDFRDDQTVSTALLFKNNFSNGEFKSLTRTFRVWLASLSPQPELVEMTNTMKPGQDDPLAGLIQRLNDRLLTLAKQDLAAGQAVLGERWALDGDRLTLRLDRSEVECPLSQVSAIEQIEDHVCLWRRGQDEAFARIPARTANAHLLSRLVGEHLEKQPRQNEQPPEGSLGRILFERKAKLTTPWLSLVMALLCFIGGTTILAAGLRDQMVYIGLGMLVVGGLLLLLMVYQRRMLFRCHEYGVYHRSLFSGERSLRYTEVASFTYSATRFYYNGAYTGTQTVMTFEPVPEKQGQRISYSANVQNQDAALDELRDRISRVLAARMALRVASGEAVPWLANLTVHPTGLEYRPGGFFGKKEPVFIPYNTVSGWNLDAGTFYLWQQGKKKPTIQEGVGQANFFPGYCLLELLNHPAQEPAGASGIVENEEV